MEPTELREQIIARIRSVPALPTSATRIITMLQDPDVETRALVREIEYDPGLTANVLRWANSAYFGGRHSIVSVRDAAVRLGMKRMNQLIMTSVVGPVVGQAIRGYDLPPGKLLEHSVAVAIGADEMTAATGSEPPGHAFTAGLLHDVGKIVLGTFVEVASDPVKEVAKEEGVSFDEAERRILGTDHAEVGASLLHRWSIPEQIIDVVRWHHQPQGYQGEDRLVVDVVHVIETMADVHKLESSFDEVGESPDSEAVERLKLDESIRERVASRMHQGLDGVRVALDDTAPQGGDSTEAANRDA